MKKSFYSKLLTGVLLLTMAFTSASFGASTKVSAKAAPKTIIIGTGNAFKPYCYLDDKGKLQGYELEVLKAVNKKLPQYKFVFQSMDFKNVLLSLESKKVDIAAHQFEKNPVRAAKYLFSNESYTTFILRITVSKDRTDINSIEDLKGKTVQVSPGSNDAYVLETYNKAHNNAIKLVYSSSDNATTIKALEDGRIDAFISITRVVESLNKAYGDKLKTVGKPIASSDTYYIFRKSDKKLKDDIDGAIKALRADGTLSKISIKVLGGDYTTND